MTSQLTRRDLLRAAGMTSLALAATQIGSPRGQSLAGAADSPEAFLNFAYKERARAASSGNPALLDAIYDPSSRALLSFEKERAAFMQRGLGSRWDGNILGHRSSINLISLELDGTRAACRFSELIESDWIQQTHPIPLERLAAMAKDPGKFHKRIAKGPRGEITSKAEINHEVQLERSSSGWRILRDEHDEFILHGRSPDLQPGSWAAYYYGKSQRVNTRVGASVPASKGPGLASPAQSHLVYNYNAAVGYAHTYWSSYYGMYCNYNACGGDCANFVSQCFRQGNHPDAGLWYTFNGGCGVCGTSATYAGTDTWANNLYLRNFMINQGRATTRSSVSELGYGDIVNYDQTFANGWHHITLVTVPGTDTSTLVTGHNPNVSDYIWHLNWSAAHLYTWMEINFHQ